MQESFQGAISAAHSAHQEFRGKPAVLIPETIDGVKHALQLAQALGQTLFVRSGNQNSSSDRTRAPGLLLSMEKFDQIKVFAQQVQVGAAATVTALSKTLAQRGLFLPLGDKGGQSLASALFELGQSPFLRSRKGLPTLREVVTKAEILPTEGAQAGVPTVVEGAALEAVLSGQRAAVLTSMTFDADPSTHDFADRWARLLSVQYQRGGFEKLCNAVFLEAVPPELDVSVRVTASAFGLKLVLIRISGCGEAGPAEAWLSQTLQQAGLVPLAQQAAQGSSASLAAWVNAGPSPASEHEAITRYDDGGARPFRQFRREFFSAVDYAIGADSRSHKERAARLYAWAELQLTPEGLARARAEIGDAGAKAEVLRTAQQRMARAMQPTSGSVPAPETQSAQRTRGKLRSVAALALLRTDGFALAPAAASVIPGFQGTVLDATDRRYSGEILQYANRYDPSASTHARMRPRWLAYPLHAADVIAAAQFAEQNALKVVARSGGHQYCGLSSGGADTLLLDMSAFMGVTFSSSADPKRVRIGPGVQLQCLSTELRKKGVCIPHGECPKVNIGGHVQTGGIGHQLRSLGATLDHVLAFKMVTHDLSAPGSYTEQTFRRPSAVPSALPSALPGAVPGAVPGAAIGNDDVFRAVLGGGPGSFGVLTEITFELVADADKEFSNASGYSFAYPYDWISEGRAGFTAALEQFRVWAKAEHAGTLPDAVDLFLTVISGDFPRPAVMLVETMCLSPTQRPRIKAVIDAVDRAAPLAAVLARFASTVNGPTPLSEIADAGVRKIGAFGMPSSGREFDLAYRKSLYITTHAFSAAFRDAFVDLVDRVLRSDGLKVVFQGVIGGAKFKRNASLQRSHMQRRDALVQLVFDVFYAEGYESHPEAFQAEMKALLTSYSDGADLRMFWGSFEDPGSAGAQLQMRNVATQQLYYDAPAEYARLQSIKRYIDAQDRFHTRFTVQV